MKKTLTHEHNPGAYPAKSGSFPDRATEFQINQETHLRRSRSAAAAEEEASVQQAGIARGAIDRSIDPGVNGV